ncbi:hypothetical protein [Streptobacillus canis]|uniref:hypothetical protein n=1 Tax=Streptobacillus canis TaxID=2678686 RepID=UPI0012E1BB28|nr:hypothetical protein [Streptobacillus canis]
MNKEILRKYSSEIISFLIFIGLGIVFKYGLIGEKSLTLLVSFTLSYIVLNAYIIKNIYKSTFIRLIINAMFFVEILILFMGTINLTYFLLYNLVYLLFLGFTYKTEGIVGVKRGGLLYILYGIIKLIFMFFLAA